MIKLLQGLCPYCYKPLDKEGNCSKTCALGTIEIEKKRLQAKIDKQKEQDKTTDNRVKGKGINKV